jgi:beta-ureidopropionase / N-carbamoyl-L-amino-acid hydrolase
MNDPPPAEADVTFGIAFAGPLFEAIGKSSFDGVGFTRAAYGEGEQKAHDIVAAAARDLGLRVEVDAALNLSITLPGEKAASYPPLILGSHLDAVPQGGNFDGLAGVLAGLACLAAWRHSGRSPPANVMLLAIRAEESAWFGAQHVGSRALLGTLPLELLQQARRVDTDRSLGDHMREAGVDVCRLLRGTPLRHPSQIRGYVELHIEQGPTLTSRGLPLGVVSGIRGSRRCRRAICRGSYGHSGTVARALRNDAVFAVSELVMHMDELWRAIEDEERRDVVLTFGQFATDAAVHSVTTIPGVVNFSFDCRADSQNVLERVEIELLNAASAIAARRGVTFAFDPFTGDAPVEMDRGFQALLLRGARDLGVPSTMITSGAGHDAGDFAAAGVPSAMIFVRNDHGSHNPKEAMELRDFSEGVRLMTWFAANLDNTVP